MQQYIGGATVCGQTELGGAITIDWLLAGTEGWCACWPLGTALLLLVVGEGVGKRH